MINTTIDRRLGGEKMNKRNEGLLPFKERALLSDADLAQYLSTGLTTARKISKEAGAVVYFGRSKRNDRRKIDEYLKYLG